MHQALSVRAVSSKKSHQNINSEMNFHSERQFSKPRIENFLALRVQHPSGLMIIRSHLKLSDTSIPETGY